MQSAARVATPSDEPLYSQPAVRKRVLGGILPRLESACALACGTGTTALLLAAQGVRVFGVDLSPAMCRLAR
jgi:SAM-dependent methyltransferase